MELATRICFLANVCHVCKSKSTLYTCKICKMIFYCSEEHRKENWFDHSQLCWALSKICAFKGCDHILESFNGQDFTSFRHDIAMKCTELLKRGLKPWEYELIYHPRVCYICHEYDWEKLKNCKECEFVYTCKKHNLPKNHKKWCKVMKLYSDINTTKNFQVSHKLNSFEIKLETQKLHKQSMVDIFSKHSEESVIEKAWMSEVFTYPLTILNSLYFNNLNKKKELTILFIGAELEAEVEPLEKWEIHFLHYLDNVEELNLIFLGPELRANSNHFLVDVCDTCRMKKKLLKCKFVPGIFFHECKIEENAASPDIICAFNSGMYREIGFNNENSWENTIPKLFTRGGPPVLITEYTCHELKMDLEKIKSICGDVAFIVQPKLNPFASLKPGLNIISENDAPVIFKNYYYVICKNMK